MNSRLLSELLQDDDYVSVDGEYNVPLGAQEDGTIVTWDMDSIPHVHICGKTGRGKTNLAKCIILSLASYLDRDKLLFAVIDTKGVDYRLLSSLPQALVPVIMDMTKAKELISWAAFESDRRLQIAAGLEAAPSRIFLVIDDFALAKLPAKTLESLLRIMRNGRKSRIHCIIVSSPTSVQGLSAEVRANAPCRINFYAPPETNSQRALNTGGAETLIRPGEAVGLFQGDTVKYMTPLLTDADEEMLIKAIHARFGERPSDEEVVLVGRASAARSSSAVRLSDMFDKAAESVLERGQAPPKPARPVTPFALELSGRRQMALDGKDLLIALPLRDKVFRASIRVPLANLKAVEYKNPTLHKDGALYLMLPDDFSWEGDMALLNQLVDDKGNIRLSMESDDFLHVWRVALGMAKELHIPCIPHRQKKL